jgi:hypothetical protein
MPDLIYLVDPSSKRLTAVQSTDFSSLGIRERKDLETWVVYHPEVLGEPLLIITSEFDRFDRSGRRLDLLALNKEGVLVVVELKLDLSRSFADQQAIRYAAFCSTMTMEQLIRAMVSYHECTEEESRERVQVFLEVDALPELGNKPRIILAGGSLDDEELTRTVLWLRSFGLDITCLELTPYSLPNNGELILAPRTIIPLPEAKNYIVKVEQKQVAHTQRRQSDVILQRLWELLKEQFNGIGLQFKIGSRTNVGYLKIPIGHSEMHYEWNPRLSTGLIRVALHFESDDRTTNERRLNLIATHRDAISKGIEFPFHVEMWGKSWATAEFRVPWDIATPPEVVAPVALTTMQQLIQRTWSLIEPLINNGQI